MNWYGFLKCSSALLESATTSQEEVEELKEAERLLGELAASRAEEGPQAPPFRLPKNKFKDHKEFSLRSAISRAYYAAFLTARDSVESRKAKIVNPDLGSHEIIIVSLLRFPDSEVRKAAKILQGMKSHRVNADYHNVVVDWEKTAVSVIEDATTVIRTIKTFDGSQVT